jgi:sporadic carbohydrate cluster protein (TIGR04323 family)
MSEGGYRGYIVSRPIRGSHFPQRVQNLVVRDYAQRRKLAFRLSVTEYAMAGCTMMFESLLGELPALDGVVLFSLFALPAQPERRLRAYATVLDAGKTLHAALENLVLASRDDIAAWEDIIGVDAVLAATPFAGRYEKTATPLGADAEQVIRAFGL